jgi:hypothetical protein
MNVHRIALVGRRILLIAVLVCPGLAAVLVAITASSSDPHGGLAEAVAIRAARGHADPGALAVTSAVVRHDVPAAALGGPAIHHWVWLVTFHGQWHLLCGGTSDFCNPTTEWVAVDYYTGRWVRSEYAYPA